MLTVRVQRELDCNDLPMPSYQTEGAAGMDLYAAVENDEVIPPGEIRLVSTGLRLSIPRGHEAQVRPRSGLALKFGIGVLNAPGTIDSDYRGILGVILFNFGKEPFIVRRGDRIAQIVFHRVERMQWEEVEKIDSTERGDGGFGHTGL